MSIFAGTKWWHIKFKFMKRLAKKKVFSVVSSHRSKVNTNISNNKLQQTLKLCFWYKVTFTTSSKKALIKGFTHRQWKKSCPFSLDGSPVLGSCTTGMRAAICHGRKKNNRPFTISIPNTNHIHNANVIVSLFKGTSLRTRNQHFWCRRTEKVFDNEKLNANHDHVLSQEEALISEQSVNGGVIQRFKPGFNDNQVTVHF